MSETLIARAARGLIKFIQPRVQRPLNCIGSRQFVGRMVVDVPLQFVQSRRQMGRGLAHHRPAPVRGNRRDQEVDAAHGRPQANASPVHRVG